MKYLYTDIHENMYNSYTHTTCKCSILNYIHDTTYYILHLHTYMCTCAHIPCTNKYYMSCTYDSYIHVHIFIYILIHTWSMSYYIHIYMIYMYVFIQVQSTIKRKKFEKLVTKTRGNFSAARWWNPIYGFIVIVLVAFAVVGLRIGIVISCMIIDYYWLRYGSFASFTALDQKKWNPRA